MSVQKFIVSKTDPIPFTQLPNHVLQNIRDIDALGLWVYLSSLPTGWEFFKDHLKQHFNIGSEKINKLFGILIDHNLIKLVQSRNKKGQFLHTTLDVRSGCDFKKIPNEINDVLPERQKPCTANRDMVLGNYKEDNNKETNKKILAPTTKPRASQISHLFMCNVEHAELADELGLNLEDQRDRFINYYLARGKKFINWQAAFMNWLKRAKEFKSEGTKIIKPQATVFADVCHQSNSFVAEVDPNPKRTPMPDNLRRFIKGYLPQDKACL